MARKKAQPAPAVNVTAALAAIADGATVTLTTARSTYTVRNDRLTGDSLGTLIITGTPVIDGDRVRFPGITSAVIGPIITATF